MNFYTNVIQKDSRYNSPFRISDIALLEPVTRCAVRAIMEEAALAGTPLILFETYRSAARQQALFKAGATQLRDVGVHSTGMAADLVKNVAGGPCWKGSFDFLGVLARKHGLVWGGAWSGSPNPHGTWTDLCHVQRVRVAEQPALFAGTWWPEPDYTPWEGIA